MILSGWTRALLENKTETSKENGASASNASQTVSVDAEEDDELQILPAVGGTSGKKRKLPDSAKSASSDISCVNDEMRLARKAKESDNSEGIVMLDENGERKKKRMQ